MDNNIFNRFSDETKKILMAAQKIAQTGSGGVGSEHLLLALSATPQNLAYDILRDYKISFEQLKMVINFNQLKTSQPKGLAPELKKILQTAAKKAYELKETKIKPEHLLWAILNTPDALAYQIIMRSGAEPELIKEDLQEYFQDMAHSQNQGKNFEGFGIFPGPGSGFYPEMPNMENMLGSLGIKTANKSSSKSNTPMLDEFGLDLTNKARKNELDPVIGRQKEIERIIQILCRRTKNNPVLVGDPGVGKTAVVEGVAQKIASGEIPPQLKNKRLILLDLSMLVAGTVYRGQFEERLKRIIKEIIKTGNIIIFIDEIHTVVGTGSAEGSMDAANILKPQLAKGEVRLIGATTQDEYRKHIEKDAALERRLQKIDVAEPSVKETMAILKGLRNRYETHHGVEITDEALTEAARLAKRYIADRFMPDKAIDLIDEAASATHLAKRVKNHDLLAQKERELAEIIAKKEKMIDCQNFAEAALTRTKELNLKEELAKLNRQIKPLKQDIKIIGAKEIARVVSLWTGVPLTNLIQSERKKLLSLKTLMEKRIIGQNEAVETISQAIKRARSGIGNPRRPIGAFMFLGPTGVGKTELAKVLAELVFGSEENLIKIDMSEFMEKHTVSRLVGAPPGYVGYEEAGKLTEQVRRKPYSVILFDEIEKAHPEVYNILLQIMEDGYLTDAKGRRVNFRNTIIILTSNIGVKELTREAAIGFQAQSKNAQENANRKYERMKDKVLSELKEKFRPEFLNRLDKTIVFKPLDKASIKKIAELQVNDFIQRVKSEHISLEVDKKTIDFITQKGYDPDFGARPIRRVIADYLESSLADKLLTEEFKKGDKIKVSAQKNKIVFRKLKK